MDKTLDHKISKRIIALIEQQNLNRYIIAELIGISTSSFNDILSGKSPWRIPYLSVVALYFGITTDELIFGDKDFIEKNRKEYIHKMKSEIKEYLVKEKKFEVYGRLIADGFFKEIEK